MNLILMFHYIGNEEGHKWDDTDAPLINSIHRFFACFISSTYLVEPSAIKFKFSGSVERCTRQIRKILLELRRLEYLTGQCVTRGPSIDRNNTLSREYDIHVCPQQICIKNRRGQSRV